MNGNKSFCPYCGKAQPQINSSEETNFDQPLTEIIKETPSKQKKQRKLSASAIKAIITFVAIVVLIVIVSAIYYPNLLPWNW